MDWLDRPLSGAARGSIMALVLLSMGVLLAFGLAWLVVIIGAASSVLLMIRRRRAHG